MYKQLQLGDRRQKAKSLEYRKQKLQILEERLWALWKTVIVNISYEYEKYMNSKWSLCKAEGLEERFRPLFSDREEHMHAMVPASCCPEYKRWIWILVSDLLFFPTEN